MSEVPASAEPVELENDEGFVIDGLQITCDLCGHCVEVYGTSGASARRGGVMLREECPRKANNFYVVDWSED